ncbi:Cyanophycinase [Enhygromyxa salina]|uniref:Cyanophycinase n=1 Tax=Enhygromyxa salina TaxID=215803 RepID=A0A0C2CPU1_9BACT|nr:cyanophycinase [Enhygromyxa salina]KIG11715.1 Cyanophycinase [Enhygromyxa salina]
MGANARGEESNVPAKVQDNQSRGYIVPVGGAEDKDSDPVILRRFVEISGDEHARIAVIPTASRLDDTGRRYERIFKELGAADALALDYKRREDADNPEWLEYLHGASGVFLTGGNQLRISTILGGTDVARAIRSVNASGVSVGGTSAGAAILSEHMIAFGKSGATPRAGMVSLAPGFGLTNRIVIDQHFRQRDRIGRLLAALAYNPFAVGIGLDEDTAAFIDGEDTLEVFGSGAITVVDASKLEHSSMGSASDGDTICMTGIRLHILNAGGRFNLHTRVATPPL